MFLNLFTVSSQAISEDGKFTVIYFTIGPYILITKEGVSLNFSTAYSGQFLLQKCRRVILHPCLSTLLFCGTRILNFACAQPTAHSQATKTHKEIAIPVVNITKCGTMSWRSTESFVFSVGGNLKVNVRRILSKIPSRLIVCSLQPIQLDISNRSEHFSLLLYNINQQNAHFLNI